jgi:putative aldouronate transport system substrate-binding protein
VQINQIWANIKALYDEAVSDMIMRGVTDDKWNTFVRNLEASGANQYIAYYQKGIDEYFAANPD